MSILSALVLDDELFVELSEKKSLWSCWVYLSHDIIFCRKHMTRTLSAITFYITGPPLWTAPESICLVEGGGAFFLGVPWLGSYTWPSKSRYWILSDNSTLLYTHVSSSLKKWRSSVNKSQFEDSLRVMSDLGQIFFLFKFDRYMPDGPEMVPSKWSKSISSKKKWINLNMDQL